MVKGTIIGIDPGSTNLGLGLIHLDLRHLTIMSSEAFTLEANKLSDHKWLIDYHPDRFRRMQALHDELFNVFRYHQPFIIASESPFYNRLRPNAYGVLVEVIETIRRALFLYNPRMALQTIDPPTVKKHIGASGNAKKEVMQEKLSQLTAINLINPFESLDEHSVDALAVAYGAYKNLLGVIHEV